MTTHVEIIAAQPTSITVALYYLIPEGLRSSVAADPDRVPAGSGLTVEEVQQLKDGTLFEVIQEIDPATLSLNELQKAVELAWRTYQGEAKKDYIRAYSYVNIPGLVGRTWDGTTWG